MLGIWEVLWRSGSCTCGEILFYFFWEFGIFCGDPGHGIWVIYNKWWDFAPAFENLRYSMVFIVIAYGSCISGEILLLHWEFKMFSGVFHHSIRIMYKWWGFDYVKNLEYCVLVWVVIIKSYTNSDVLLLFL